MLVGVALLVAASVIPVVGLSLALKRRLEKLADNQLFIALGAAQTDASSLQRSLPALESETVRLKAAAGSLREALRAWTELQTFSQLRELRTEFRALLNVLR